MYIHLGLNEVIPTKNIVGIFDLERTTVEKITKEFLSKSQKKQEVIDIVRDIPKSFIISVPPGEKQQTVFISQIASVTLGKRGELITELSKGGTNIG